MMQRRGADLIVARRLCDAPFVMLTATFTSPPLAHVEALARRLGDRPGASLVFAHWSIEAGRMRRTIPAQYHAIAAAWPAHRVIILCNTAPEVELLRAAGVEAVHCNHNLMVSEAVFDVDPAAPREFDAIYVARMHPYKRHALAREIARLAIIYYGLEDAEPGYYDAVRADLPYATFVNELLAREGYGAVAHARAAAFARDLFAARRYVVLRPQTVAAYCNRARVGLCLSAREGAMYSSMEYMLCGLPVVSTENVGARDHFFDPDYCITVPADPAAIAGAAAELARRAVPPELVRARTLEKVAAERAKLRALLADVLARTGAEAMLDEAWVLFLVKRCTQS